MLYEVITIAMHLAMNERADRARWVGRFYDILSRLEVTVATPTLSNARKPFHQLSSCFIDTVPDSLDGIYRSIDNFAQVSKYGGGMGMYFGKVVITSYSIHYTKLYDQGRGQEQGPQRRAYRRLPEATLAGRGGRVVPRLAQQPDGRRR